MSNFTKMLESYRMSPGEASLKSKTWFNQQILLLSKNTKLNGASFIKTGDDLKFASKIKPGSMYIFKYDPKYADSLPYYDMYPLVFPFNADNTSFAGLNMHYIHPYIRAKVLDALQIVLNNDKYDDTTKLRLTWGTIQSISKMKMARACVKKYLVSHVDSQIMLVSPKDWVGTLMLPLDMFVGANKRTVWNESWKV